MAEYNLPEEYYQSHGYTNLSSGSGPHLGAGANMSYDVAEKSEIISAQPMSVGGKLKCFERTKTTRSLFTWRLNPQTHKFSLVEEKFLGITYGPLIQVPCPKALKNQYDKKPELIDEEKYKECPEKDKYGTEGKEPDAFYADFFKGKTVTLVQRTPTTKGQVDLLEIDGFVYAKLKLEDGEHCYKRSRHIKARLYWTFCPRPEGWHLQEMTYYVNLWGPWQEIPCKEIPKGEITLSSLNENQPKI